MSFPVEKNCIEDQLLLKAFIIQKNKDKIKYFLEHGANVKNDKYNNETLLHLATQTDVETVKFILELGANINSENLNKRTPLNKTVCESKDIRILRFLIKNGADINKKDRNGWTPLHNVFNTVSLPFAASDYEITKLLLENGADIIAKDYEGVTPLHLACKSASNLEIVKLLIEFVDPNSVKNNAGSKPLHFAVGTKNNIEIVKLLILKGADINEKNKLGLTPFNFACKVRGNIEMIKFLYHLGADIKARENYGALHMAATTSNNIEIIEFLLENGAEINEMNKINRTALHEAATFFNLQNVKILLQNGADVNFTLNMIFSAYGELYNYEYEWFLRITELKKLIRQYLIKLNMFNLINDNIFDSWRTSQTEMTIFEEDCKKEAKNLGDTICFNRNVKISDLLTRNEHAVAIFLSVDDIKEKLSQVNYDERFPTYSELLKSKIKRCTKLAKLLTEGYKSLQIIFGDFQMPDIVVNKVLKFLSKQDLNTLKSNF